MLASAHFGIARTAADDWFDPILDHDTKLFVDPFLVFRERLGPWAGAHDEIVAHFNQAFLLVAQGNRAPDSLPYKKAVDILIFREPKELCLGYTPRGTAGLGSGFGFAKLIATAIADAIERGLAHPRHFEELGILQKGIGSDRISDIACTVLKRRLIEYTQGIARRHALPMARHRLYASGFDGVRLRWQSDEVEALTNPVSGGPLLLAPERFLRDLPVLNADDWWDHYENERLRQDVNYHIMGRVDKATIIAAARRDPEAVRRWTEIREGEPAEPYDIARDKRGVWQWEPHATAYAREHPLQLRPAASAEEFNGVIDMVTARFKHFVEEDGGWKLLWDDQSRKEKHEQASQLLFKGIAKNYCMANDISLDREVELGCGSVDFKFSTGYARRGHLEVKKLENSKFWNGLQEQLPAYMRADEVSDGWFLVMRFRSGRQWDDRWRELQDVVQRVAEARRIRLRIVLVDARPREPASAR